MGRRPIPGTQKQGMQGWSGKGYKVSVMREVVIDGTSWGSLLKISGRRVCLGCLQEQLSLGWG